MIALPVHQQLEDARSAEMTCNIKIMLISKRLTNIDINNQRLRTIYRTCNLLSIRPNDTRTTYEEVCRASAFDVCLQQLGWDRLVVKVRSRGDNKASAFESIFSRSDLVC